MTNTRREIAIDQLLEAASRRHGLGLWYGSVVGISLIVATPVFIRLTSETVRTDIMDHARLTKGIVESGQWLSYSFWYPLLYVLSGGANSLTVMRFISIALLSLLVAAKSVLVFWAARRALGSLPFVMAITVGMMVVTPLLDPSRPKRIYLGQISATVWHNSTTILAAPLALAAFLAAICLMRSLTVRNAAIFSALMVLSTLAKPNFSLAFLPVIGIATLIMLWRARRTFAAWLTIVAVAYVPAAIALVYQFVVVYVNVSVIKAKPAVAPFVVWNVLSPNIALSLALSLTGPLLILLALTPERRKSLPVVVSWLTLIVAILQLSILGEMSPNGDITAAGNWFWGSYTALMVVFLVSMIELVRLIRVTPRSPERATALFVAGLALVGHIASGIYYLLNIGVGSYASY